MTILLALVFFSVIIMIHELGHFLTAKAVGIHAEEFSIGMGPRLYKYQGKETEFSIRALPIGGYVRFLGEDENSSDPRAFGNASVWKRMAVIIAGPLMNILLAVLLLSIYFLSFGVTESYMPVIDSVISGYPAEQVGLQPGDKIIQVGDLNVSGLEDREAVEKISSFINNNGARPFTITVEREGQPLNFDVIPSHDQESDRYQLGFYFRLKVRKVGFFESIGLSFVQTFRYIGLMLNVLKDLIFHGQGIENISGPVGIVNEIGKAARAGFEQLLNLGLLITINLGIMNLIPFPALDGGRLAILLVEGIRRKPLDKEKEGYIHLVGFVLLMILMIIVTYKDIISL